MRIIQHRRDFLASLSAAGAAGVLGARSPLADEPPPETTTIRVGYDSSICLAPDFIANDLLRAEGFTDIRCLPHSLDALAHGDLDFDFDSLGGLAPFLDAGEAITILAGVRPGCYELLAREPVRTISELKGKRVGISSLSSGRYFLLKVVAAYVGLDPEVDINWVAIPNVTPAELFEAGEIDAFMGFPPEPQELRARKIGRVILNTAIDRPWSQYFCCMCVGNADYVRAHPVATKRFLRATLKAADVCAAEPAKVAKSLVAAGYTSRYDLALQTLTELPYASWREFNPEDTIRFYALRFHEVGVIKTNPNQLISSGPTGAS